MTHNTIASLPPVVAGHIDAVNAHDEEVIEHHGDAIVRGRYDGTFDKTNLPAELILTNYFTIRDGKIVSLIVIRNTPPAY